ncbi:MAG: 3-hydroxyacyl-ACP dehydratase FabZ [Gammaproteobacteria bacterium]
MSREPFLDIHAIMKQLPHRYPFLLVDRVLECKLGRSLTAVKNVTINEPFFPGHFPRRPVMPGVLILEALAQATGLLTFATLGHAPDQKTLYYFVGIDNARFKKPVEPGDQLILKVEHLWNKRGVWKYKARAEVDGQMVTEAELMCTAREFEI